MDHTQYTEMVKKVARALMGIEQALKQAKNNPDASALFMGLSTSDTAASEISQLINTHEAIMDCVKEIELGNDQFRYLKQMKKLLEIFQHQLREMIFTAAFNGEADTQKFLSNMFNAEQKDMLISLPNVCAEQMKTIDLTRAELDKLIDAIMAFDTDNAYIQDRLKDIVNTLSSNLTMKNDDKEFKVALVLLRAYAAIKQDTVTLDTDRLTRILIEILQVSAVQKGTEEIFNSLNNIINNRGYWASYGDPKDISKMKEILAMPKVSNALKIRMVIDRAVEIKASGKIGKFFNNGQDTVAQEFCKALADMDWKKIIEVHNRMSTKTKKTAPFTSAP